MKLTGRQAKDFIARGERFDKRGILLYGADAVRVSLQCRSFLKKYIGTDSDSDMRLTHFNGSDLQKKPFLIHDGLKTRGFFAGRYAVWLSGATDSHTSLISNAAESWCAGDAALIVSAGSLKTTSSLRKFFEKSPDYVAIGVYNDPLQNQEMEQIFAKKGLTNINPQARAYLYSLGAQFDPIAFENFVEKLVLFTLEDAHKPLSAEHIDACLPGAPDAAIDDIINAVCDGESRKIPQIIQRLKAQNAAPVSISIAAARHFRILYGLVHATEGIEKRLNTLRPPVFGPRRARLVSQAQAWSKAMVETALENIIKTDLTLRKQGRTAPEMALIERAFVRIALLHHKSRPKSAP